jgi:hypothetical protein
MYVFSGERALAVTTEVFGSRVKPLLLDEVERLYQGIGSAVIYA